MQILACVSLYDGFVMCELLQVEVVVEVDALHGAVPLQHVCPLRQLCAVVNERRQGDMHRPSGGIGLQLLRGFVHIREPLLPWRGKPSEWGRERAVQPVGLFAEDYSEPCFSVGQYQVMQFRGLVAVQFGKFHRVEYVRRCWQQLAVFSRGYFGNQHGWTGVISRLCGRNRRCRVQSRRVFPLVPIRRGCNVKSPFGTLARRG